MKEKNNFRFKLTKNEILTVQTFILFDERLKFSNPLKFDTSTIKIIENTSIISFLFKSYVFQIYVP